MAPKTTVLEQRLRSVEHRSKWNYCWRCRMPFAYEDLHYTGIDVHGEWRFECEFCRAENKHGRMTCEERIRAHTISRQRLFEALIGDEIT